MYKPIPFQFLEKKNRFQIIHKTFQSINIFFLFKALFSFSKQKNIWLFAQENMQGYNVETTFPLLNVMRIFAHKNWLHTVNVPTV